MGLRDKTDPSTPMSCDFVLLGPSSLVPVSPIYLLRTTAQILTPLRWAILGSLIALSRISCLSSHSKIARGARFCSQTQQYLDNPTLVVFLSRAFLGAQVVL